MLERILGTRSKVRILREMLKNPDRDFALEDLVRATEMSYGTIHPAIKGLVETRTVLQKKVGQSKIYNINQAHVLFHELTDLIKREATAYMDIAVEFVNQMEKEGIENIYLFGSVARGEVIDAGDIDLLIIYSDPKITNNFNDLNEKIFEKYDVLISPLFLSKEEVKERILNFDDFILRVMDEGEMIYGDAKWLEK